MNTKDGGNWPARPGPNELPPKLRERCRWLNEADTRHSKARHVVYWMHTGQRTDENPALEVACWYATQHSLPLLVYHPLADDAPFSSARHHTFVLQSARELQTRFAELGVTYRVHLACEQEIEAALLQLAESAALIVTEDMPTSAEREIRARIAAACRTPWVCVDTACVVPPILVGRAFTRAFEYRNATKELYAQRVRYEWTSDRQQPAPCEHPLPFSATNLDQRSLHQYLDDSRVDPSVVPVSHTRGGSRAGYARWNKFKLKGLPTYDRLRNDALADGVSRMSAYLHYGMVSPFRLAREAAEQDGTGAEKFLDELLIWRELAYCYCHAHPDHGSWGTLPTWARESLESHAKDARPKALSWEQLARGRTGDPLWDVAQQSLVRCGELHNNLRMTWGKALLQWTETPQEALRIAIDLNHRFALDGRDPASYGGLLWCFGQFDRPFRPEQPIFGCVRTRPTSVHARRLDAQRFAVKVRSREPQQSARLAVIGAGMAGLSAARTLHDLGWEVDVFEKSRGVGGRMATRRVDEAPKYDHGAQYFTARSDLFRRYVDSWLQQGIVAAWPSADGDSSQRFAVFDQTGWKRFAEPLPRFVGVPSMNAICRHLAAELRVHRLARIDRLSQRDGAYQLWDEAGVHRGSFDRVLVAVPAEQASTLLRGTFEPELLALLDGVSMTPCWAAMVSFSNPVTDEWVGAFLNDSILTWCARNGTKPGRASATEDLVLHAAPEWSGKNWETPPDQVGEQLLGEFWRMTGFKPQPPVSMMCHRWRYAIPRNACEQPFVANEDGSVVACGDWAGVDGAGGGRVEGAFLGGLAAAGRLARSVLALDASDRAE